MPVALHLDEAGQFRHRQRAAARDIDVFSGIACPPHAKCIQQGTERM
jgi:hypothetical protein